MHSVLQRYCMRDDLFAKNGKKVTLTRVFIGLSMRI